MSQPEQPPFCPPSVQTATGTFDPAGYDPEDCAGCGLPRSEHVQGPPPNHLLRLWQDYYRDHDGPQEDEGC